MSEKPSIEIHEVSKIYGEGASEVRALDRVSMQVYPGEILMLLGPSGSGKTTLLSIMGAILKASSGVVRLNGHEITALKEKELPRVRLENIGFIFQGFNLFPALTAQENVSIGLKLRGMGGSEAKRKAAELLEQVGLSSKLKTHPANLSGGQKQRVAIARALAGDPPIILADEPTASLDSQSGETVMGILSSLAHQQGRSVVIVTHDPRVLAHGDRTIRIADGRIADLADGRAGKAVSQDSSRDHKNSPVHTGESQLDTQVEDKDMNEFARDAKREGALA
jgi:putative ABC transport system ATP-binding protein